MKIGIAILATNAYFVLGIRFIKKFMKHYKGNSNITFYFFSDTDPSNYLPSTINVKFIHTTHMNWVEGTNSKFLNIISLQDEEQDYLYYFDADTNVNKDFEDTWLLGDMVGGEHYANRNFMKNDGFPFDRNPRSAAYIPKHTTLPKMYYYGAFFGGKKEKVIYFCKILRNNQLLDKKINYEPGVNDESYINQYFHYNPPAKVVTIEEFPFLVSDKGGLGETRDVSLDIKEIKNTILHLKDKDFDIKNKIVYVQTDMVG
jgi:hypothetical protein